MFGKVKDHSGPYPVSNEGPLGHGIAIRDVVGSNFKASNQANHDWETNKIERRVVKEFVIFYLNVCVRLFVLPASHVAEIKYSMAVAK